MDKLNKLSLPTTLIIASLILGGFIFATQVIKQQSIERQQETKLQEDRRRDKRDYIAKRKKECLGIYKTESAKYSNVHSWSYYEPTEVFSIYSDVCEISYKDKDGNLFYKHY